MSLSELLTSQQNFPDSSTEVLRLPLSDDPITVAELNFYVMDGASLLLWMTVHTHKEKNEFEKLQGFLCY